VRRSRSPCGPERINIREHLCLANILDIGDQIESYRIEEVLSRTRTSSVFRATNTMDGQTVALKVPDPEMETDPFHLERFRRAAEIGEKLGHHGVVRVFSEVERSCVYIVMEWCDGKTPRQVMNAGTIMPERAIRIATAVLEALQYPHDNGVVHRALTPDCIMVAGNDAIKLIDFGQASEAASRRLTYTNLADELGTVDYISPEQVAGRRCDGRTDFYAMGVILYEMLTGTLPFTGSSPAELMKARVVGSPMPPSITLPSISLHLQEVLYRSLKKDPRNRYARASDFTHDLHHLGLAAVGAKTRKTEIHAAVIKMRYENANYLAKDASAADLISDDRSALGNQRRLPEQVIDGRRVGCAPARSSS
jgi:eukaryotic-like serine/threonine-protein kinase